MGSRLFSMAMATAFFLVGQSAEGGLINPSFEYGVPVGGLLFKPDANTFPGDGWRTTASDGLIEIWGNLKTPPEFTPPVPAYHGQNFVELNANEPSTLYQTTTSIQTGDVVDYHFAHRGRSGDDTMRLTVTNENTGAILFQQDYTDGMTAWGFYMGNFVVGPNVQSTDTLRFAYESVSSSGGGLTVGNFIDFADFGIGVNAGVTAIPEPGTFLGIS